MRKAVLAALTSLGLGLVLLLGGCGKSDKEVQDLVNAEKAKTEAALQELAQARAKRDQLRVDLCKLLCVQLKQAQSLEQYVGSGRKAEYDALVTNIKNTLNALGCPPCD